MDERDLARGQIVGERGERGREFAILLRNIEQKRIDAQRTEHLVVGKGGAVAIIVRGCIVHSGDPLPHLRRKGGIDTPRHQLVLPHRTAGEEAHRESVTGQFGEHFGCDARVDAARSPEPAHLARPALDWRMPFGGDAQLFERTLHDDRPRGRLDLPHIARHAAGQRFEDDIAIPHQSGGAQVRDDVRFCRFHVQLP